MEALRRREAKVREEWSWREETEERKAEREAEVELNQCHRVNLYISIQVMTVKGRGHDLLDYPFISFDIQVIYADLGLLRGDDEI